VPSTAGIQRRNRVLKGRSISSAWITERYQKIRYNGQSIAGLQHVQFDYGSSDDNIFCMSLLCSVFLGIDPCLFILRCEGQHGKLRSSMFSDLDLV